MVIANISDELGSFVLILNTHIINVMGSSVNKSTMYVFQRSGISFSSNHHSSTRIPSALYKNNGLKALISTVNTLFLSMSQQPLVGQGLLIVEAWRWHSDTPDSVGLLWTRDQPVAETSTWQHTTLTRDRHPCPRRYSNPQSQQASGRRRTP
jgi:hypothetical protein